MENKELKTEEKIEVSTEVNVSRWQDYQELIKDELTLNDISI
jgi:hypothetical protein